MARLVCFTSAALLLSTANALVVPSPAVSEVRLTISDNKYCVVYVDDNSLTIGHCDDAVAFTYNELSGRLQTRQNLCVGTIAEDGDSSTSLVGLLPCDSTDASQNWHHQDDTWRNDWGLCLAYDSHETVDRLVQKFCTGKSVKERFVLSQFFDDGDDDALDN